MLPWFLRFMIYLFCMKYINNRKGNTELHLISYSLKGMLFILVNDILISSYIYYLNYSYQCLAGSMTSGWVTVVLLHAKLTMIKFD